MSPRIAAGTALLLLAGCRHPPGPPPRPPPPTEQEVLAASVRALSTEAEALLRAQDELLWKHWTEGAPLDISKTYEGHDALFTAEAVKKIDRLRQLASQPSERRALTNLEVHFVGEDLSRSLTEQTEAIAALEASLSFSVNGRDFLYRDLDHELATEKSAFKRQALYAAATPAVERLSGLLGVKRAREDALLRDLGYPSYEAYGAALRDADLVETALLADQVLQTTQAPYEQVLGQLAARELQAPAAKLRRADFPRLFRSGSLDKAFTKQSDLPRATELLHGLGLDLASIPGLKVDDQEGPKKNHRPFAVAVRVPGDVRLSLAPAGGVRATEALLHELGHALHFALAKETRFELTKLGDRTAYEAFSRVFEELADDPTWLKEATAATDDKLGEHLATASAYELYQLRLQAAHVLYEVQLQRTDASEAKALYASVFSRALGIHLDAAEEARYVVDQEDFYSSADGFRASLLAGQIEAQLKARFGPAWWHQSAASGALRTLWAPANGVSAADVAHFLGDPRLDADQLLLRLGAALHVKMALPTRTELPDAGTVLPERTDAGSAPASLEDAGG